MSNSSRIIKAESELDKAEKRLRYSLGITDDFVDKMTDALKVGEIGKELQRLIDKDMLSAAELDVVKAMKVSFQLGGAMFSAANAYYQGDGMSTGISLGVDSAELALKIAKKYGSEAVKKIATRAIPIVGQGLLILDGLNLIDKYIFNDSKLFDLKNHLNNFYDKLSNTSSDLPVVKNGVVYITMPNGEVYARPIQDKILQAFYGTQNKHDITTDTKSDVLFGGKGDDYLNGGAGKDILIGGAGKDDYMIDNGDTIRDSDGKGRVFLYNNLLTGGTQIEKGLQIYKGKDGVKYELKGSDLIINDNATIENFSNDDLGIHLSEFDEINVTISDEKAKEKAGKMSFKISLNRRLNTGEEVLISVGDKTFLFTGDIVLGSTSSIGEIPKDTKIIPSTTATYEYTWEDEIKTLKNVA